MDRRESTVHCSSETEIVIINAFSTTTCVFNTLRLPYTGLVHKSLHSTQRIRALWGRQFYYIFDNWSLRNYSHFPATFLVHISIWHFSGNTECLFLHHFNFAIYFWGFKNMDFWHITFYMINDIFMRLFITRDDKEIKFRHMTVALLEHI